jgi:hypothetical protein
VKGVVRCLVLAIIMVTAERSLCAKRSARSHVQILAVLCSAARRPCPLVLVLPTSAWPCWAAWHAPTVERVSTARDACTQPLPMDNLSVLILQCVCHESCVISKSQRARAHSREQCKFVQRRVFALQGRHASYAALFTMIACRVATGPESIPGTAGQGAQARTRVAGCQGALPKCVTGPSLIVLFAAEASTS